MTDYNKLKKFAPLIIIIAILINGIFLITKYENTSTGYLIVNAVVSILVIYRILSIGFVLFSGAKNHSKHAGSVWGGFILMFRNVFLFIFLPALVITLFLILFVGKYIK